MKNCLSTIIICLLAAVFSSCHGDLVGYDEGEIAFFRFTDSTLVNKVLLSFHNADFTLPENCYSFGRKDCYIPLYPKNIAGEPLFGEGKDGTDYGYNWIIGEKYTLEDLVSSPKFIALKDGWYICWPFTQLEYRGSYVNVEWKDLMTMDVDRVRICTNTPYTERYVICERELRKLTHKSTKHFPGWKRDEITMDDVVEVLNDLIETGSIKDHCSWVMHYN